MSEAFIARAISGRLNTKTEAQRKALAIHQRFYTALVLNTLVGWLVGWFVGRLVVLSASLGVLLVG